MEPIVIKSQANNRVRLQWELFDSYKNIEQIEEQLEEFFVDFRANLQCRSIVFVHNKQVPLEKIIEKLYTLFSVTLPKISLSIPASESICGSNSSCNRCEIKDTTAKSFKQSLVEFGLLTLYAGYLFFKEHVLGFAVVATPFSLVAAVALVAAIPLLKESYEDIKQNRFTLQTFMGGTLLLAIFFGEATAAFEIIYILRGGMLLEEYIATKSKDEIQSLVELDIQKVYVLHEGVELEVDIQEVQNGDIVVSRSGEKIPVDGTILDGSAEIDESLINGRSEPQFKEKSDLVYAGTLCEKGRITIEVEGIGKSTYISRTLQQVEKSLALKSPSELEADRLAGKLLKLGTVLTVGTLGLTGSLINAFAVMIVMSCPCATVLAASTAISAGISKGAKNGVLIKGGEALEEISQAEVFCFDKTGTLTTGKPIVSDILSFNGMNENELLQISAMAEYRNTHPIAQSIVTLAKQKELELNQCILSTIIPGYGVETTIENDQFYIGNKRLLEKHNISYESYRSTMEEFLDEGKTVVFVAKNDTLIGMFGFIHEVRVGTKQMIRELKSKGVKHIVLLTGDEEKVANGFAKDFEFDAVFANRSPQAKAEIIDSLKQQYKKVVMVGDGVNDTFAMSKADVAVSFAAGGSEAAIAVSDIAITHSHPEDVTFLYDLSHKSLKVVNQNYWLGTGTNLVGVAFASVGMLSPVAAGAIHIGHTVGIMANSSRLAYF